jgi:hypothetical protein
MSENNPKVCKKVSEVLNLTVAHAHGRIDCVKEIRDLRETLIFLAGVYAGELKASGVWRLHKSLAGNSTSPEAFKLYFG